MTRQDVGCGLVGFGSAAILMGGESPWYVLAGLAIILLGAGLAHFAEGRCES